MRSWIADPAELAAAAAALFAVLTDGRVRTPIAAASPLAEAAEAQSRLQGGGLTAPAILNP